MSLRGVRDAQNRQTTLVTIHSKDVPEQTLANARELRQLLGLSPDATEFKLVSGSLAADDRELAIKPRSLLHIMGIMAAQVEVPAEDVARGRAAPGVVEADRQGDPVTRLARILSSTVTQLAISLIRTACTTPTVAGLKFISGEHTRPACRVRRPRRTQPARSRKPARMNKSSPRPCRRRGRRRLHARRVRSPTKQLFGE
jgi:hypothetical protein